MNTSKNTTIYIIALAAILIAFLLLGGGTWMNGMIHGNRSIGIAQFCWTQILISLGIGILVGFLFAKRKR